MNRYFKIAIVLFLVTFYSCKKIINIDINNANTQIVILGKVTNLPGPYLVTLSQTINYSSTNIFPAVTGAKVFITSNGTTDSLTELSAGNYYTHNYWTGTPNQTYTLNVIASGKNYSASSTMPTQVNLDSMGFYRNVSFNKTIIEPIPYFKDPINIANYYQFTEQVNSSLFNNIFIFSDQFSDGRYLTQPLFAVDSTSKTIKVGDTLSLNMYCIDKNAYNYLFTLQQLISSNSFNATSPANPSTNLSNGALGYFSAQTVQTKTAIVR